MAKALYWKDLDVIDKFAVTWFVVNIIGTLIYVLFYFTSFEFFTDINMAMMVGHLLTSIIMFVYIVVLFIEKGVDEDNEL